MLGSLLGGMFDKEGMVRDTITSTLEDLTEELSCTYKDLFVTIQPMSDKLDFKMYVYKKVEGKPTFVREIPLAEIVG